MSKGTGIGHADDAMRAGVGWRLEGEMREG
jgi:hypothetical protein